jgi:precorrin-3B methylase
VPGWRAGTGPGGWCAMRFEESDLLQDLGIVAAVEDGDDIYVSIYGGRDNACGSVRFTFPDAPARARHLAVLQRWATDGTPVALLSRGDTMTIFSEAALLARAAEPA